MDWFLYDNGLRHERVKVIELCSPNELLYIYIRGFLSVIPRMLKSSLTFLVIQNN